MQGPEKPQRPLGNSKDKTIAKEGEFLPQTHYLLNRKGQLHTANSFVIIIKQKDPEALKAKQWSTQNRENKMLW